MARLLRFLFYGIIVRAAVLVLLGLNVRHRERLPVEGPAIIAANHNSHLDTMVLVSLLPVRLLQRIRPVAAMDYFLSNRLLAWFALDIIGIIPLSRNMRTESATSSLLPPGQIRRERIWSNAVRPKDSGQESPETKGGPQGRMRERDRMVPRYHSQATEPCDLSRKPGSGTSPAKAHPLEGCRKALARGDILIFFPEGSRGEPELRAKFKSGLVHLLESHPEAPVIPVFMHGLGKALPKGEALLVPFFCDVFVGEPLHWQGERADFMSNLEASVAALEAEGRFPEWD